MQARPHHTNINCVWTLAPASGAGHYRAPTLKMLQSEESMDMHFMSILAGTSQACVIAGITVLCSAQCPHTFQAAYSILEKKLLKD